MKFRTPILVHYDPKINLQSKASRYKLPFKKDEAVQQVNYSLISNQDNKRSLHKIQRILTSYRTQNMKNNTIRQKQKQKKSQINNDKQKSQRQQILFQHQQQKINKNYQDQDIKIKFSNIFVSEIPSQPNQKRNRQIDNTYVEHELSKRNIEQTFKESRNRRVFPLNLNNKRQSLQKQRKKYFSSMHRYAQDTEADNSGASQSQTEPYPETQKKSNNKLPTIEQKSTSIKRKNQQYFGWKSLMTDLRGIFQKQHNLKQINKNKRKLLKKKTLKKRDLSLQQRQTQQYSKQQSQFKVKLHNKQQKKQKKNSLIKKLQSFKQSQNTQKIQNQHLIQVCKDIYNSIFQINPFFRKISQIGSVILLRVGQIMFAKNDQLIFNTGDTVKYIQIILVGKLKLTNNKKNIKQYLIAGQTTGQQVLFQDQKSYVDRLENASKSVLHKQQCRSIGRVCLLSIKTKNYYKMGIQLSKSGNKSFFNLFDNLLRINYIKKQTIFQYNEDYSKVPIQSNKKRINTFFV